MAVANCVAKKDTADGTTFLLSNKQEGCAQVNELINNFDVKLSCFTPPYFYNNLSFLNQK
jgi:hypothetical protein